jgi:hypothetical protein
MNKLSKSTKRRRVLDELQLLQLENNDQCTEALSDGDFSQDNNNLYCCDSLSGTSESSSNRHREVHDSNNYRMFLPIIIIIHKL